MVKGESCFFGQVRLPRRRVQSNSRFSQMSLNEKTGAYPKISSRCASVGAAVLLRFQPPLVQRPVSGPKALMVGRCPRFGLRVSASVSNPHWVQSPDGPCPTDPIQLAPSLLNHSPVIDRKIISSSCEKQTARFDHLPVPGLSCGSSLTGRWFVRLPSDGPYMTLNPESDLMENGKLSTGSIVNGGKLLLVRWINSMSSFRGKLPWLPAGPALRFGRGWGKAGPLDQPRRLDWEEDVATGIVTLRLRPEPLTATRCC